jgi:serine/threonine protein kinase/WD40 repeat protein
MDFDESATPMSDETVYADFLKDLDAATDVEHVIEEYAARYPHLAGEMRQLARIQRELDESEQRDKSEREQPARLGDFRIIGAIAEGGMGTIYEAIQHPLNRRVAVKTIRGESQHLTGTLQARFLREQKVLARLHHTHIVPIIAAGRDGALQYFAMSYIDGAALHHVVRTARLHETSSRLHGGRSHPATPTLAVLAAEAKSSMANGHTKEKNGVTGNGQPAHAAEPTTATLPNAAPPPPEPQAVADHPRVPGENGDGKITLSLHYFRSAARVMIDAAEAVQHAHEVGIIHRDLKPSNLMVDTSEHCWVLDFGLAGYLRAQANGQSEPVPSPASKPSVDLGPDLEQPLVSGVLGTPDYMAPEQFQGRADARTDVWGLGVIFYELLTLRRAFHGKKEIESSTLPPRPRDLVQGLPLDLEAICIKALQKSPGNRYQAAKAMADDLRRWIKGEPVTARRTHTLRRLALWSRRNPGWAAAIMATFPGTIVAGIASANYFRVKAEAVRRELLLQSIQHRRTSPHEGGWSDRVWGEIREAASAAGGGGTIRRALQSQAVAGLFGLDVRRIRRIEDFGADTLAFDRSGAHLLIGGVVGPNAKVHPHIRMSSKLLYSTFQPPRDLATAANGPVAFRPDGTPVQLVATDSEGKNPDDLSLVDMSTGRTLTRFVLPGALASDPSTPLGLSADALLAAAPVREKTGATTLIVWDAASARERRRFTWQPTSIAFSPDGSLVASGSTDGNIAVWSLATGARIADLGTGRTAVQCLTFGRDTVLRTSRNPRPEAAAHGWLLAAGDRSVAATYDIQRRQTRSICRGGLAEIFAVAFAPDGATVASSGRDRVYLWDVATGRMLLSFDDADYSHGLVFAPDGRRLATGKMPVWGAGLVSIVELELSRGIQTYRGLAGPISAVWFSAEARRLAALSNDWQAAVWERDSGRLVAVIDAPPAQFVDNASLALSPDGRRLAYAGGHEARVWDLDTGVESAWSFRQGEADHEGRQDQLAFTAPDRLLSARVENQNGKGVPAGATTPDARRVIRVRNLLGSEPLKPLAEVTELDLEIDGNHLSSDGKYLVVTGFRGPGDQRRHLLNGYEASTGKRLWSAPFSAPANSGGVGVDPTSSTICFDLGDGKPKTLLEIEGGKYLGTTEIGCLSVGPLASLGALWEGNPRGVAFRQRHNGRERVLFTLLRDSSFHPLSSFHTFTRDGRYASAGNADGSVLVFDFEAINRRLSEIGLGW